MAAYALLLRAVNVGKRQLPMATLREVLSGLGYDDVQTYLQSGNAVVSTRAKPATVSSAVSSAIQAAVGFDVDVVVRTGDQLADLVAGWPFDADAAPTTKHVVFAPSPAKAQTLVDGLSLDEFRPERLAVAGADVYLSVPDGLGRSPLAAALAKRHVKAGATTRNWNTVVKLAELTSVG